MKHNDQLIIKYCDHVELEMQVDYLCCFVTYYHMRKKLYWPGPRNNFGLLRVEVERIVHFKVTFIVIFKL